MLKQKILITGSEGLIGTLLQKDLMNDDHDIILLDKKAKTPIDLLKDNIEKYFSNVDTVIHLAACSGPQITYNEKIDNI